MQIKLLIYTKKGFFTNQKSLATNDYYILQDLET